ncbi:hypothetical protein P3W45_000606 [Vairimorpha bombi]|jgi:cell fate regulator YaaT (PSP1 superfamily)
MYHFVKHYQEIWVDNDDVWDERCVSWKAIGNQKVKHPREVFIGSEKLRKLLSKFFTDNLYISKVVYHIIEYKSGRLDVGYDLRSYEIETYVIVEADRGEDCGKILGITSECKLNIVLEKLREGSNEMESKRILRYATLEDMNELRKRHEDEDGSLEKCRELVIQNNINMEILSCEYQWDKKKITFYFKSAKRIDFRDLLKDLFKLFKIRIWLCAEKKSLNVLLKGLVEKE